jgi:TonB family protein
MKLFAILCSTFLLASVATAQPGLSDKDFPIDRDPVLITPIAPVYPERARLVNLEGSVYLVILVGADGKVMEVEVDSSDHEWFTQAAIEAVKKASFTPAITKGKAAKVWYSQKITFKLTPLENVDQAAPSIEDEECQFVDEEPKAQSDVQSLIVYPDVAKRNGIEGKVILSALIGLDGRVQKVEVEQSDNSLLNDAAREAVLKARFTPAICKGEPLRMWVSQVLNFRLE